VTISWLDIDWKAAKPDGFLIKQSHRRAGYERRPLAEPAVDAVVAELDRSHVNGGALAAKFGVVEEDAALRWYATRDRFAEWDFFRHFLGSPAIRSALPELAVPDRLGAVTFDRCWAGTLALDGELAAMMVGGGAYERFRGTHTEAKRLGTAFVDALVGERHGEFRVYRSRAAWAGWFYGIGADSTTMLIDLSRAELTLLCVTDTD
jgi:hypothetical protein